MEKALKSVSNHLVSIVTVSVSLLLFNAYFIGSIRKKRLQVLAKGSNESHGKEEKPTPPPMAKEGFFESLKILISKEYLHYMVRTARELKSQVYHMKIHYYCFPKSWRCETSVLQIFDFWKFQDFTSAYKLPRDRSTYMSSKTWSKG